MAKSRRCRCVCRCARRLGRTSWCRRSRGLGRRRGRGRRCVGRSRSHRVSVALLDCVRRTDSAWAQVELGVPGGGGSMGSLQDAGRRGAPPACPKVDLSEVRRAVGRCSVFLAPMFAVDLVFETPTRCGVSGQDVENQLLCKQRRREHGISSKSEPWADILRARCG